LIEKPEPPLTVWQQRGWMLYGSLFILLSNLLLLSGLLWGRTLRINDKALPYFGGQFIPLLIVALFVIGITTSLIITGRMQRTLRQHRRHGTWLLPVIVLIAVLILPSFITIPTEYVVSLYLWGFGTTVGFAIILLSSLPIAINYKSIVTAVVPVLFGIALPLALLEVSLRFYFNVFGTEQDRIAYIDTVDEALERTNRYTGQPYINYGLTANHPDHNRFGYRGVDFAVPKPKDIFRIFVLGGSTTYGTGLQPFEAHPAQLQRILHDDYGYTHIEVVNAGAESYSSFDSLANLSYHILDHEPDMILIYHGINDVLARLIDPQQYSGLNRRRGIWSAERLENRVSSSVLIRFLQANLGFGPDLRQLESFLDIVSDIKICTQHTLCTNLNMTPEEVLAANPPIYFERNLRNMVAIARANAAEVVFSTWAFFPEEVNGARVMTFPFNQQGVAQHNDIVRNLGVELGVPVYDLAQSMPENIAFWIDTMHMSAAGTREQAAQYAAFLVENDLLPPPPKQES